MASPHERRPFGTHSNPKVDELSEPTAKASAVRTGLAWAVVAFVLTLGFELLLCWPLIAGYFPTNDELAIELLSTRLGGPVHPYAWVTQGFHHMLACYPEWGDFDTDVWRPLANALFWLHYELAGTNWGSQLVFGYVVHATIVGLIAYLAITVFRLGVASAVTAVAIAALNPGLWSPFPSPRLISNMLQFPIHQVEMVCALLMLLAFLAFIHERYLVFAIFGTLGVCCKETALTAPLSAIAIVAVLGLRDRSKLLQRLVLVSAPLLIWLFCKLVLFQYGFASRAIIAHTRFGWLTQPIRNLLLWPSGLFVTPLKLTQLAWFAHDIRTLLDHAVKLTINLAWWVALALGVVRVWQGYWRGQIAPLMPAAAGLIFALGNLGLVVALQDSELRYGYFWFALGPAALFAVLPRWRAAPMFPVALGAGLLVPELATINRTFTANSLGEYARIKGAARQLTSLLHALPPSVKSIYVVDDAFVAPASPAFLRRLSGVLGEVVLVDSIERAYECAPVSDQGRHYSLRREAGLVVLDYLAPPALLPCGVAFAEGCVCARQRRETRLSARIPVSEIG